MESIDGGIENSPQSAALAYVLEAGMTKTHQRWRLADEAAHHTGLSSRRADPL
jgi:hypothetical protein